jgi:Cd2+/Zn2+-exporting ATPase
MIHDTPQHNSTDETKCCSPKTDHHHSDDGHDHDHNLEGPVYKMFLPPAISLILLVIGLCFDHFWHPSWFLGYWRMCWYILAYLPVGIPVIKEAYKNALTGAVFSEFFLMSIATIGAMAIKEFPEAVAVMLFYTVGEVFQTIAVSRAKTNIRSLLDQRPDKVTILKNNIPKNIKAAHAQIGDIIQLKAGEKLALDGELMSETSSFNTAALTGESKPDTKNKGAAVLAGMINLNTVSLVKVTTAYSDSKLSRILELVQHAATQKAPTELFIRKFARIYTPIVVYLAVGICFVPYIFVENYVFNDWLYKALVFLVISCPCALVISIPLGYFGGIGAASKKGILFKGGQFLDSLAAIQHVVMDKTGTLTEGVFKVQEVAIFETDQQDIILKMVNALESKSTHPVATAIHDYVGNADPDIELRNVSEIPGYGLRAEISGKELLVGNFKLLDKYGIAYDVDPNSVVHTMIAISYNKKFAGYLAIADVIKEDAASAIEKLKKLGIKVTMLSGDKSNVVQFVAKKMGIANAFGDLLPEDKVEKLNQIKAAHETVAFVGDGVNDAPVVALSTVGIAMGGLGSDATIETADVVIQDDKPTKIPMAIQIGRETKKIVWQNVILAFSVKAIVLALGAGGLATMWEAVFADVGVALLAILNAIRIQRMKF